MHLLFENLVPNMIQHWLGEFKGLDQGAGNYEITEDDWMEVGRLTVKAARTIPSFFVGTLPNIAQDRNLYKAEAYSFWFQYLAPILLKGKLPNKYYKHFLLMREVIAMVLQFEITYDEIDKLERMINQWVSQYEEYAR
ncbi:hypothetical protein CTheo_9194 [Ceratobasidium theobromae]|uniref:Uncharacterized protein n=1 Tax=Ceratobasidium theobromae TaxID=1582974 RepID=A0A5N5Q5U1_9AGAM|nr:hypothetical protein CTheo_9194 [Ceratobasidium theobromae]